MSLTFFLFFACQEKEVVEEKISIATEPKKIEVTSIVREKPEPLVYSPMDMSSPLVLSIDTSKVNSKISQAFLSEEAQRSLFDPLHKLVSGSVLIEVSAPIRPGTEKPKITIQLSRDQFLSLANIQSGLMDTQQFVQVFHALNQYRMHGGNNSDLRIFHFWLVLEVGKCHFFPEHQDAFSPINELDVCVDISGEKHCGKKQGEHSLIIPKNCIQTP